MKSWISALAALAAVALASQLVACGGGSSSSSTPAAPVAAKGIGTPASISVVTAK